MANSTTRRSCPFTAELSVADLLMMARAELSEARVRLAASYELLERDGAIATRLSQAAGPTWDDLAFTRTTEAWDNLLA